MLEVGTASVRTRAEGRQAIPSPSLSRDPVEPVSNTQNKETNTLSLTYDGNPLGVSRTGARQADGSLGWSWGGVRSGPGAARTILLFISLVLVPLNSLVWWEVPLGYIALG